MTSYEILYNIMLFDTFQLIYFSYQLRIQYT